MTQDPIQPIDLIACATEIVAARVTGTEMNQKEIIALMENVYAALVKMSQNPGMAHEKQRPFVPVEQSIQPDYLVCLEDGRQMKMLRRYLRTTYDMSPEEYREKWNLPADYPMTAPNYAKKRSSLAKDIGLGKSNRKKKKK